MGDILFLLGCIAAWGVVIWWFASGRWARSWIDVIYRWNPEARERWLRKHGGRDDADRP